MSALLNQRCCCNNLVCVQVDKTASDIVGPMLLCRGWQYWGTRGCGSGSCTHLCMFNNGGTCFDSDLVPHLNKYWELISYNASKNSSGPILGLNSNCSYQRGSYFFKTDSAWFFSLLHYFTYSWMKFVNFLLYFKIFFCVCPLVFLSSQKLILHLSVLLSIIVLFIFDITFSQHMWVINSKSGLNSRRQMLKPM